MESCCCVLVWESLHPSVLPQLAQQQQSQLPLKMTGVWHAYFCHRLLSFCQTLAVAFSQQMYISPDESLEQGRDRSWEGAPFHSISSLISLNRFQCNTLASGPLYRSAQTCTFPFHVASPMMQTWRHLRSRATHASWLKLNCLDHAAGGECTVAVQP